MKIFRVRWLDASAIIKFLVAEQGTEQVRKYLKEHSPFDTTWLCLGEVFGRLKSKYEYNEITQEEYLTLCDILLGWVYDSPAITIHDIPNMGLHEFREIENLVNKHNKNKKHKIDFSDALQIYILKTNDFLSINNPILVTADNGLAQAAKNEGLDVWDCRKDPPP